MKVKTKTFLIAVAFAGFQVFADSASCLMATSECNGVTLVINYDKSKVGDYELENPLTFADGCLVSTAADWRLRRAEILEIFAHEMYGAEPPKPDALVTDLVAEKITCDGYARRRQYAMYFRADRTGPCINWFIWIPTAEKRPVPVILFLNYRGAHEYVNDDDIPLMTAWSRNGENVKDHRVSEKTRGCLLDQNRSGSIFPLQMILARGYAIMTACYCEVSPDPNFDERIGGDRPCETPVNTGVDAF